MPVVIQPRYDVWVGGAWRSLQTQVVGDEILLKFGFSKEMNEELKVSMNARWDGDRRSWVAPYNARSAHVLDILSDGECRQRLTRDISSVEEMPSRDVLREHQVEGFKFGVARQGALLGFEMGLGKTLTVIELVEWFLFRKNKIPVGTDTRHLVWVVGPKNLERTWKSQTAEWDAKFTYKYIRGHASGLEKALARMFVTPSVLIVDEIGEFRKDSAQTRLLKQLSNSIYMSWGLHDPMVIGMTGTAMPQGEFQDWWNQVEIVRPGVLREGTVQKFEKSLAVVEAMESQTGGVYQKRVAWRDGVCAECNKPKEEHQAPKSDDPEWKAGEFNLEFFTKLRKACAYYPKALCKNCNKMHRVYYKCEKHLPENDGVVDELERLPRRLKAAVITKLKSECPGLPEKLYIHREAEPDAELIRLAETVMEQCETKLQVIQRLTQLSDGFLYVPRYLEDPDAAITGDAKKVTKTPTQPKLDLFSAYLRELDASGVTRHVVCASYRASIVLLEQLLVSEGWQVLVIDGRGWRGLNLEHKQWEVGEEYFNCAPITDRVVLLGNPQSMGLGLNLQIAPNLAFYSNGTKAMYRQQAMERINRLSSEHATSTIVDFSCLGVDKVLRDRLMQHTDAQELTMEEIRSSLEL